MSNFEKTSAQTPENATTNTFWQAISKLPFAKQAMFIASFSALVGCGGEKGGDPTPEPYKDTEKPKITATAVVVSDLDGDGVKDDASFNVKATDNKGIKALDVFVNGNKQNVEENGDVKVLNVPVGTNTRAITAIDTSDNEKKVTDTFQVEQNDTPPTPEAVDLPDLTYKKSLDNTTVTEDVSYTSVGNNTGHAIVVKKTINGVATEYILTNVNGDQPEYTTTKASLVEAINNASLGDALLLNMAETYESGYGLNGFTRTTGTAENGQTAVTIINQHGETVSVDGYRKGIQYVRETFGVSPEAFLNAPNQAFNTGNDTKLNWQICRAFTIEFGKKMQQTGATDKTTVQNWAAEAYTRVKNMTPEQRREMMLTVATETGLQNNWD